MEPTYIAQHNLALFLLKDTKPKKKKLKWRETQEYDHQHCSQTTTVEIHPIHSPSSPHMAAERKNAS